MNADQQLASEQTAFRGSARLAADSVPGELNVGELFTALRGSWWLVSAAAIVGVLLGIGAARLATPVYRAQVILAPAQGDRSDALMGITSQVGDLGSLIGLTGLSRRNNAAVNLAYLQSRGFTEAFIRNHDLLPILFARRWDAGNKRWKSPRPRDIPSYEDGVSRFIAKARRINEDRKTGLITFSIQWTDPQTAAQWANGMVADLNTEMRNRAASEAEQSIKFLNDELASTQVVEVRQAINRVIESQIKAAVLARVRSQYAFEVVDAAKAPDLDKPVSPNGLVFCAVGLSIGACAGTIMALRRRRRVVRVVDGGR